MKSYITTPIYYVNGAPHIGHAHTSVMADILKRNRTACGIETMLTTGTDEHGQKNEEAAHESGLATDEYLTMRSGEFQKVFDLLNVDYDYFVRTSRKFHMEQVAHFEQLLLDAGLIVKKQYKGIYCTGCEQFKKLSDLDENGRCPDHPSLEPEELDELNYFMQIEPFRKQLIDLIESDPDFVSPAAYRSQLLNMLEEPLEDLCISRPVHRVSLGVRLPFDPDYVTYVWFDALINYVTNLKWPEPGYAQWWDQSEHLIGKDILKTHGIYWPIMLLGIGEKPPGRLSVHGHWVGQGGLKMSKTLGNTVDPIEVANTFGVDALRYYLARHMRAESDSQISMELLGQTYNSEMGNKIGNLFSRAGKFAHSRFDGKIPSCGSLSADDERVRETALAAAKNFAERFELRDVPRVTQDVVSCAEMLNEYFAEQAPWELIKNEATAARCATVIYVTLDCLRLLFEGLRQIIPQSSDKALETLGSPLVLEAGQPWSPALDDLEQGGTMSEVVSLFPRVTL